MLKNTQQVQKNNRFVSKDNLFTFSRSQIPMGWSTFECIITNVDSRGCSSSGRALALHVRGTGIDTPQLHFVSFSPKAFFYLADSA